MSRQDITPALSKRPPEPSVHRDVVVGPLLEGSGKNQLIFEVHPASLPLVQTKSFQGELKESAIISGMGVEERNGAARVDGPVIYAGPYLRHFGHFVAEGIHRLYAKTCFDHLRDAKVAFLGSKRGYNPIVPWLPDVLALCGVSMDDVLIIARPTRFAELHVPVQGRVLGGVGLIEDYNRFFPPGMVPRPAGCDRKLYFSRARYMFKGSYLGEAVVERVLAEAGFEIVYPESLAVATVVRLMREASVCLFTEGSAIHNLELSGRLDAKVGVVSRRPQTGTRFNDILNDLSASWTIWGDEEQPLVCLDWNPGPDKMSKGRGCSFIDIRQLVRDMARFTETDLRVPSVEEVRAGVSSDLASFVLDPRSTESYTSNERLGFMLRDVRTKWLQFENELSLMSINAS